MHLPPASAHLVSPAQTLPLPTTSSYILSVSPLPNDRLLLSHGNSQLTVVDRATFKAVDVWEAPAGAGLISDVVVDAETGAVWTCGKEGGIRGWDGRSQGHVGGNIFRVPNGKPTPLLSLAYSSTHNLLAAGTELTSHEAAIVFWDTRNTSKPLYSNTAIHSDDITSLSFAPASLHSRAFPIVPSSPGSDTLTPKQPQSSAVLLSGSTDGLLALSNALEADEDESALGIGNVDVSVAKAGWVGEDWDVWARDDMDGVSRWDATDFTLRHQEASLRLATEESTPESNAWSTDYLVDVLPSSSASSTLSLPFCLVGDNSGNMSLLSHTSPTSMEIVRTLRSGFKGHRDVVRSSFFDPQTHTLYTGSEDAILCAWDLAPAGGAGIAVAAAAQDVEMGGVEDAKLPGQESHQQQQQAEDSEMEVVGEKRGRSHDETGRWEWYDNPPVTGNDQNRHGGWMGGDGGWGKRGRR